MTDAPDTAFDYSQTLYLPKTDFPMRAGLPQKEPEILARWAREDLYAQLRESGKGRPKFVLHDGPPYANGNVHIGTALNKILKDMVVRSHQMAGKDSNYVPGWDCHGLPIEWKVEEEFYRKKGKVKPDFSDPAAIIAFRRECRAYAEHWLNVQREEFKRLGVIGDWDHPYLTMSYPAEAQIAREIFKFVANGLLYRGSKPVMWSVVEKTALAEAEVEYEDHTSDTIYVAFPVEGDDAEIVIWTTTPWTIPGNRAIAFSRRVSYGRYRVTEASDDNWAKVGSTYILADSLAEGALKAAKATGFERLGDVSGDALAATVCAHPLRRLGYGFVVPLLEGDHVTEDAGTGFVHTAPSHGREDFELWTASTRLLQQRGVDTRIPYTVDEDGVLTDEAPGFTGRRVLTEKGEKGDANDAVIKALIESGALIARGKLKHQYPHSWRSKKPVIFRNTPQWFLAMDRPFANASGGKSLRELAVEAIESTRWVPRTGENRIKGMVANKPDWVLSRQRAWGVPLAIFVRKGEHEVLYDEEVNARIAAAFETEGADAWFAEGAKSRFLGDKHNPDDYDKVDNLVEVWFDSGSTHAFVLEDSVHFPGLAGIRRAVDGGPDEVMYLEGSDQHRGWFQSSLLESCGTRGRAPFDIVLTHGFTLDEKGRKQSKSLGNQTFPQDVIRASGADILRLWVASVDYSDDQRIGAEILKAVSDNYRKLRNTIRWMLGTLAHFDPATSVGFAGMAELDRLMLHKLADLDGKVREAYANFDYARVISLLSAFMNADLSAFYFDIRKDALYCDPPSSARRLGALEAIDRIFRAATVWLAPVLVFTAEEAWASRNPDARSVHLEQFPAIPETWRDEALARKWDTIRALRLAVTGAIEIARADKAIGSSLEAAPRVWLSRPEHVEALRGVDFAEVCITSDIVIETEGAPPDGAFRLPDLPDVAVVVERARGIKCARSWRYFDPATAAPGFPDVSPRDAAALRELRALGRPT
ncbi:isoleucyl-tRNA synthetase [Roseiarcus fermentans]|uniref:Isoleucine--tRNA ligase n=1 Tax=Roseiarcus fermentans TaxID=1473586 RepID=A0A366FQJ4_9HYPH|nr:isoleucine--tRNA ligase [Roseiarcus fermentans]RBP16416.1 isoleucyl-tRNA synthetase [Roseiarcus fermentans]